jgi:hypothetical protein
MNCASERVEADAAARVDTAHDEADLRSMFVAAGFKHDYSTPLLSAGHRTAARFFQKAIS